MSRESNEQNAFNQYEDNFPRGKGDPDYYGNPAEPVQVKVKRGRLIQDVTVASLLKEKAPF